VIAPSLVLVLLQPQNSTPHMDVSAVQVLTILHKTPSFLRHCWVWRQCWWEHFPSRCSCSFIEHTVKGWNNVWSYCNSVHPYLWNSAYPGHFFPSHMQGNISNSC